MVNLIRRIRYWLQHRGLDAQLREELEHHRAMKQQELEQSGMSADAARMAAHCEMGNVTLAREEARAVWIWPWLESVCQDGTYALRSLRRQPGFTVASLAVLGIAIGLNTSLFTVFAGLALRPMAGVTDPSRVVTVKGANPLAGARDAPAQLGRGLIDMSFPEYHFLAAEAKTFQGLVAARAASVRLESERVGRSTGAYLVTGNYFNVLGIQMEHGRSLVPDEDRLGSPQAVAVLSYQLWQSRFGGDESLVGRSVRINDIPFTVVGITSPEFTGPEGADDRVWLPLSFMPLLRPNDPFAANMLDRPQDCCVSVTGRLALDVTREQAQSELELLSRRFRATVGMEDRPIVLGGTQFLAGRKAAGQAMAILGVLFLAMMLVLLIACANVGNLLLARAAARAREIGVRLSLGAARIRIVRQLLTEGFVLAVAASAVGMLLSMWLPPVVLRTLSGQTQPFDTDPDAMVLGYSVGLAVLSCLAFALAPALHATRCDIASALKDGTLVLRSRFRLRNVLLAIQVAVSVVLLTSAGLLLRGVAEARVLDLGFAVDDVAVAIIDVPEDTYHNARIRAFVAELTTTLHESDVESFAFVSNEPFRQQSSFTGMRLPGESEAQSRTMQFNTVSSGYFDVLGIPMVAGRDFHETDVGRRVVIINQSMARRYWPNENPVGRSFIAGGRDSVEIVGIAKDAYTDSLDAVEPMFFQPLGEGVPRLLFQARRPSAVTTIASIVERLDPSARGEITPLRDRLDESLAELTFAPLAASLLGMFALGLATVGMSGVFAYVVRQRTREIGIRMALGAQAGDVIRLVLAGTSRPVIAGLGVGVLGALAASQILRGSLYGLSPVDPIAYGGVALLLAMAALATSYVPARRAVRIDPTRALRYE